MIRRQRIVETVDVDGRLSEKCRKTYRDEDFILHEDKFNYLYNQYQLIYSEAKQTLVRRWNIQNKLSIKYMPLSLLVSFHIGVSRQLLSALYITCDDDQRYYSSRLRIINRQKL